MYAVFRRGLRLFKALYDFNRFRYIHQHLESDRSFNCFDRTIIPKTGCFFSEKLDVYVDTSDGVNDDLQIDEYCGS